MNQDFKTFTGKQCEVAVIEDSVTQLTGKRLSTVQMRYPRFIHSEFMTHRALSRNASSSRAIPPHILIEQQRKHPAFFAHIGKHQSGMQAREEVAQDIQQKFANEWLELSNIVADYQERWANEYQIAKQVVNRAGEPYSFISVVASATEWDNFFELRDHEDAQPEIQDLARTLKQAMPASKIRIVHPGKLSDPRCWHLPYVLMHERTDPSNSIADLLAMSAARNARVSYLTHDKLHPQKTGDIALYRRLVESKPLHASPLEHQAYAGASAAPSANFTGGWIQHRRFLELQGSIENLHAALMA